MVNRCSETWYTPLRMIGRRRSWMLDETTIPAFLCLALVDGSEGKATEVHRPHAVDGRWEQPNGLLGEGPADAILPMVEGERSLMPHPPHTEVRRVLHRRHHLGIRPVAGPIATDGRLQFAGLVRALQVVDRPPVI